MKNKQRIEKIEKSILAIGTGRPVILREPDDPLRDDEFGQQISDAIASGAVVIIRCLGKEPRRRYPGVKHFADSDFVAAISVAALTPDAVHGNRLNAILRQVMNTTLQVATECLEEDNG